MIGSPRVQQVLEANGEVADSFAGRVKYRVRNGRCNADVRDLTKSFHAQLVDMWIFLIHKESVDFSNI